MAICLICNSRDNLSIPEFPEKRFCGCTYNKALARANSIRNDNLKKELEDKEQFLMEVLKEAKSEKDAEFKIKQIKSMINSKLNLNSVKVVEL